MIINQKKMNNWHILLLFRQIKIIICKIDRLWRETWNETRFLMPHIAATFLMRLLMLSRLPILNKWLLFLKDLYLSTICIGISISLIWNGTPVFWRLDTIQGAPFTMLMLSSVKFLMSMNDISVSCHCSELPSRYASAVWSKSNGGLGKSYNRLPQPLETQNKSIILLFFTFLGVIFRKKHVECWIGRLWRSRVVSFELWVLSFELVGFADFELFNVELTDNFQLQIQKILMREAH